METNKSRSAVDAPNYLGNLDQYLHRKQVDVGAITGALDLLPDDVVYAAGSVVEGLGDPSSDIDIFVLTSDEGFAARSGRFDSERQGQQELHDYGILYVSVGGTEFDVEYHRAAKIHSLIEVLRCLEPKERECIWKHFQTLGAFDRPRALELLHRFRTSVPIWNVAGFEKLQREFDDRNFLLWNVHYHLIECTDYFVGIERSLRSGDSENAYLKMAKLFDSLVDAELFLSGHSVDRWKWRLPKLKAINKEELLRLYLEVQLCLKGSMGLTAFVSEKTKEAQQLHAVMQQRMVAL